MFIPCVAKFKSTCHRCGGAILKGDLIEHDKRTKISHCCICRASNSRKELLTKHERVCARYI